jgi:hypothetical protein
LRILIIDDDPRPCQAPLVPGEGAAPAADGAELNGYNQTHTLSLQENGRPVVHEYQVATPAPIPIDLPVGQLDQTEAGAAEVSVVQELIARVQELLQRTRRLPATAASATWSGTIRFGSVMVEPATQTVLREGQPVRVTHTEFRLLLALIRRRGAIASRTELLAEVWGAGAAVSRRAVDTHIARLRRKLEEDPANPRHILTALAWGYRFRP